AGRIEDEKTPWVVRGSEKEKHVRHEPTPSPRATQWREFAPTDGAGGARSAPRRSAVLSQVLRRLFCLSLTRGKPLGSHAPRGFFVACALESHPPAIPLRRVRLGGGFG